MNYYKRELTPNNGRASFYGKAKTIVDQDNRREFLISYNTLVAYFDKGKLYRCVGADTVSLTTSTHIYAFCYKHKKDFLKLPMGNTRTINAIVKRFCLDN